MPSKTAVMGAVPDDKAAMGVQYGGTVKRLWCRCFRRYPSFLESLALALAAVVARLNFSILPGVLDTSTPAQQLHQPSRAE